MRFRATALVTITSMVGILTVGSASAGQPSTRPEGPRAATFSAPSAPAYVPGELLVRFRPGAERAAQAAAHSRAGAKPERNLLLPRVQLVDLPSGTTVAEAVARYEALPEVEYAEPNWIRHRFAVPNDPRFADLWGLNQLSDADIDAPEAWDTATGSAEVTVAVIDDGIDYLHEDLDGNIFSNLGEVDGVAGVDDDGNGFVDDVRGWDFAYGDADPMPADSHGTHVAGTIGAEGNNGIGIAGVNWDATLVPVRIFDDIGNTTLDAIVDAYMYADAVGADVANLSFGGGGFSITERDALAAASGTLFVAAAGNGGEDGIGDNNDETPQYPCGHDLVNLVCVAATTATDQLASFSNYGATTVDLGAPGTAILSSVLAIDGSYDYYYGTSMAAPHVAGAAALMKARQPTATPEILKLGLLASADDVSSLSGKMVSGGRLNLDRALEQDLIAPTDPWLGGSGLKVAFQKQASVALAWNADGATGYQLASQRAGYAGGFGSFNTKTFATKSGTVAAAAGYTHCFKVRGVDEAGNTSAFTSLRCTAVPANNTKLSHSKGWAKKKATGYFLNTYSEASRRGANVTLGVKARRLALVATKCRGCGTVKVFLGKTLLKKIRLGASSTRKKQIISVASFPSITSGTVTIRVVSAGKPVRIEGLGVSRV